MIQYGPLRRAGTALIGLAAVSIVFGAAPGLAQSTSATIRGVVKDDTGGLPGANIVAKEASGGFAFSAVTGSDGSFTLAGLRPATYDITVTMGQYKPAARRLTVLVGQSVDLDFRLTADQIGRAHV